MGSIDTDTCAITEGLDINMFMFIQVLQFSAVCNILKNVA